MPAICRDGEEGEVLGGVVLQQVLDRVEGEEDLGGADAHGHFQEELEGAGDDLLVLAPVLEVVADLGRKEGGRGGSMSGADDGGYACCASVAGGKEGGKKATHPPL